VLASSGDTGVTNYTADGSALYPTPVNSWPSSDPLVTSVGGTQLHLDAAGNRLAPDQVWNDGFGAAGGGLSQVFSRPDFQKHVRSVVGDSRGTPDISMSAAVDGPAGSVGTSSAGPARPPRCSPASSRSPRSTRTTASVTSTTRSTACTAAARPGWST
jgi:hypothetical protein